MGKVYKFLLIFALLFSVSYIAEDNISQAVSGGPSFNNPDSGKGDASFNPDKYNYLKKSHFTGTNTNKSGVNKYGTRFIRNGTKDEGYTCWAYNSSGYNFYKDSMDKFQLNGSAGRGNEAYAETKGMNQCNNDNKLLEYEIFAGDVFRHLDVTRPQIKHYNYGDGVEKYFVLRGWAVLGGYTNQSERNSSSYVVAVEQNNGKNTNSTNGVHIFKNRPIFTDVWDMTSSLEFGGLSKAKDGEYNRFRGYLRSWAAGNSDVDYFFSTSGKGFYSPLAGEGWHTPGITMRVPANENGDAVYGYGRNFDYEGSFFETRINLDDLFRDGRDEKSYKLYLVKRVNDMIVAGEMSIPESGQEWTSQDNGYNSGNVKLQGNPQGKQIEVARTGVIRNKNANLTSHDGNGVFFNYNEKVDLTRIYPRTGGPSVYQVERKNNGGGTRYAESQYFRYNGNNTGAVLSFRLTEDKLTTRHIDNNGRLLRVKSSGSWSNESDMVGFYQSINKTSYGVNQLYRDSKSNDNYVHYNPETNKIKRTGTVSKTFNMIPGLTNEERTLNFHYVNMSDVNRFKYRFIDNETGELLRDTDWQMANTALGGNPVYSIALPKSMNPGHAWNAPGKHRYDRVETQTFYYFRTNEQNRVERDTDYVDSINYPTRLGSGWGNHMLPHYGRSREVRPGDGNRLWNLRYQRQPDVSIEYYDVERGTVIRTAKVPAWHGVTWRESSSPGFVSEIDYNGTEYHRLNMKSEVRTNVTDDITVRIPFVDRPPIDEPEIYQEESGANNGEMLVDEFGWRLEENRIHTTQDVKYDSTHADARNGNLTYYFGNRNIDISNNTVNTNSEYKNSRAVNPLSNREYQSNYNLSNKGAEGVNQLDSRYEYTNALIRNYDCELGVDSRCFTWQLDNDNPTSVYWGSTVGEMKDIRNARNTVKRVSDLGTKQGEVLSYGIFNARATINVNNSLNNEYELDEIPDNMLIGRNILNTVFAGTTGNTSVFNGKRNDVTSNGNLIPGQSRIHGKVTNGRVNAVLSPISGIIREYFESVGVSPEDNGTLDTQSGVIVNEKVEYDNDFDEDLPSVGEGTYLIDKIDENLKGNHTQTEGKNESPLRFDNASQSFKLENVYGLSKKYGVQFMTPHNNVTEGKMKTAMNTELGELDLPNDEVVELDNNVSRYFLPIDSVEYTPETTFEDSVNLTGLGLNEISVSYDKTLNFENYLYGNILDEPVYAEQKEEVEGVEYGNSETLSQSTMNAIADVFERANKVNLFRTSDDSQLDEHVND